METTTRFTEDEDQVQAWYFLRSVQMSHYTNRYFKQSILHFTKKPILSFLHQCTHGLEYSIQFGIIIVVINFFFSVSITSNLR